ncbi:hypothetical protein C8J55DRAFT_537743 [Lentinula edodes]|uniref:Transmembrane protein n=1 Tax=Lentinula lateritia TaxID=40482 RepID=A0A9W8ZY37_9AGAR|nr:hypothetical protein C8J55DRAFT_537743 [Lentinula edodes]
MECILYGVYLVTLVQCIDCLVVEHHDHGIRFRKKINWTMLVVALLLCLFATLDVAFGLRHNLDAFIYYKGQGGAVAELQDISYWVNVMKTADYVAQTFIGDAMLIYRCYIVHGKNWKIIIPSIILWLGGTVCGALLTFTFATLKSAALIDTSQAVPYVDTMISLSLTMNVLTTMLIVWKIWSVDRHTASIMSQTTSSASRASRLHRVMRIIVESAALYTISTLIFVITYVAGSNANYGTSDNVVQIIGISFNLIIIRVDSGRSYNGSTSLQRSAGGDMYSKGLPKAQQNSYPLSLFQDTVHDTEHTATTKNMTLNVEVEVIHEYGDPHSISTGTSLNELKPQKEVV